MKVNQIIYQYNDETSNLIREFTGKPEEYVGNFNTRLSKAEVRKRIEEMSGRKSSPLRRLNYE